MYPMYFRVNTQHPQFPIILAVAKGMEFGATQSGEPKLYYKTDGTEVIAKLRGPYYHWYNDTTWYGHEAILEVYTMDDDEYSSYSELFALLNTPEFQPDLFPTGGSPE